ncbi:hypothetical protein EJ03DRAFT_221978 [Teratosphaeria nubilosa]|uniref:FAM50A/XAP5 C-terminal domain-containing protein n=1 Tax=Teratosphaeria nubilosa TaxID=161662 RepID=A0A6G1KWH8_9PEZI|nr:hypothetical protein EJ03DRAFT_221978 [Teratosphaeria nubilosa]
MADSGSSTPNNQRFQSQGHTAEDLLKEQTYGLVTLGDFRKRRAEAVEQSERTSHDVTPTESAAGELAPKAVFKKRKKTVKKGGLSFGDEEGDDGEHGTLAATSGSATSAQDASNRATDSDDAPITKKRLKPNAAVANAPKAMTKSALLRETQLKEQLRKEYLQLQEAVKATEMIILFTFFDGKSSPGGVCRMKKGEQIWLFLERARKVGADMAGKGDRSKKDWARISVDDLMVVRGDLIIPHHYDFHYFALNRAVGYNSITIFPSSAEPTAATPFHLLPTKSASETATPEPGSTSNNVLSTAASRAEASERAKIQQIPDSELEGFYDDPSLTKVVDRRWYERNKHIYPASTWEDFDPDRDYSKGGRKDRDGNAFFFSSGR